MVVAKEALNRTVWGTWFGGDYGPVVIQFGGMLGHIHLCNVIVFISNLHIYSCSMHTQLHTCSTLWSVTVLLMT